MPRSSYEPKYGDYLTPRELEIEKLRDNGVGLGEIARMFNIKKGTVQNYCRNIAIKRGTDGNAGGKNQLDEGKIPQRDALASSRSKKNDTGRSGYRGSGVTRRGGKKR